MGTLLVVTCRCVFYGSCVVVDRFNLVEVVLIVYLHVCILHIGYW